jgi:6-phosphogluconate dehydrogenase
MKLGLAGLGRMGANMARRLRRSGIDVVAWNRSPAVTLALAEECGLEAADSLPALITQLPTPRILWLMLPAGDITQQAIDEALPLLTRGDILVDGANSNYKDSLRRAAAVEACEIHYIDAGVSGGIWGLDNGYAMMLGGSDEAIQQLRPAVEVLAPGPATGWMHCGPAGSGHFVKMIHNGIEYGMMQAYAEGFALMQAKQEFDLDLGGIAEMWRHGSVVRSWLLDLTRDFLVEDQTLDTVTPVVADSGEGRWTALEAIEQGIPAPVITLALMMRYSSQGGGDYGAKMLAKMRQGFGGHALTEKDS